MTTPDWWQFVLLSLASFRVWRLIAEDDILDKPRRAFLRLGDWQQEGDRIPDNCRLTLSKFIGCAWCLGFWIALIWWGGFQWSPHWAVVAAAPWAISAVVGMLGRINS